MTRLLLITDDSLAQTPLAALSSAAADFQVTSRPRFADVRAAASARAFDVALFVPRNLSPDALAEIGAARAAAADLPIVAVLPVGSATDQQQRVLAAGADFTLFHPLDAPELARLLQRVSRWAEAGAGPGAAPVLLPAAAPRASLANALDVLRDFSQVLGYSLDYRQLTQHFVQKLREVIGLSRIAVFLEPGNVDALPTPVPADNSRLACAAAAGLPAELVECFALSRKTGLGRQLSLHPQILRAPSTSTPPLLDPKILREFEVLGGQVAIPVNDRERTVGVAVLGGRLMGGDFTDEELLLVYHLLEELGLAVRNSWLHHQLVGSHRLFASVLDGITIGALVAGPDLSVVYANRAIVRFLRGGDEAHVEFSDLPPPVAARLHEVVEKGAAVEPFHHQTPAAVYRVSVIPLRQAAGRLPQTALLLMEDFTRLNAAQRAEIEASNLKLIGLIARRFAHEIRNSLVPLTTHQQLFDAEIGNAEFRDSLKAALTRETQRIQRFTEQMLLLARADSPPDELAPLDELIRQSFAKSREYIGGGGELDLHSSLPPVVVRCNRASLAHALQEVFLNGLQSSAGVPRLDVTLNASPTGDGRAELIIQVRDSGGGFAPEAAGRATEPFYTTRNTGVGLGLTIARRVIEAHQGRLDVRPRTAPGDPDVVIHLPLPS
ncbi:MAG: PAS domain-containing protein [Opitutaceae bacterium]|nr:PAS domain-containing protein [Opitutaceae bacterium]